MKSNLLFLFTILSFFPSFSAFSQLKVNSNGKITMGTDLGYSYGLQVAGITGHSGFFAEAPGAFSGSVYGIYGRVNNPTSGTINRGVYGYVYSTTAAQTGQAYGVVGKAGNCTDGYNYGVFGNLLGTKSGAAILGAVGTLSVPDELTVPNVHYAGYFIGNVKMTGTIWANGGTITGSDERIKKEISVLDSSENIYKLLPKQYKLKTPSELLSEQKPTSDTATVIIDNIPATEGDNKLHYGFLAQELQLIYPDLVHTSTDGTLGINYQGLIPMIIDQLKNMKQSLEEKDNRIHMLEEGLTACCGTSNLKSASIPSGTVLSERAILKQNVPNPFSNETRIDCFIPEGSVNSVLYIYNMNGTQLQQYSIKGIAEQSVIISGNTLEAGMYIYALVIDGMEIDTKRMILTR